MCGRVCYYIYCYYQVVCAIYMYLYLSLLSHFSFSLFYNHHTLTLTPSYIHSTLSILHPAAIGGSSLARALEQKASSSSLTSTDEVAQPKPHPLLQGLTPTQFVMKTIRTPKLAQVFEALLTLPLDYSTSLLKYLTKMLEEGNEVELAIKCSLLLLKIHQGHIISSSSGMIETLATLRRHTRLRITSMKDLVSQCECVFT